MNFSYTEVLTGNKQNKQKSCKSISSLRPYSKEWSFLDNTKKSVKEKIQLSHSLECHNPAEEQTTKWKIFSPP